MAHNIKNTLMNREATYGDFSPLAELSQKLKHIMHKTPNWDNLESYQREALEAIQLKISRILNGNSELMDNWHDIIGYATLVEKELFEKKTKIGFL